MVTTDRINILHFCLNIHNRPISLSSSPPAYVASLAMYSMQHRCSVMQRTQMQNTQMAFCFRFVSTRKHDLLNGMSRFRTKSYRKTGLRATCLPSTRIKVTHSVNIIYVYTFQESTNLDSRHLCLEMFA